MQCVYIYKCYVIQQKFKIREQRSHGVEVSSGPSGGKKYEIWHIRVGGECGGWSGMVQIPALPFIYYVT